MCFRPAEAEKFKNICKKCRTENPPTAISCSNCGAALKGLPPPPGQPGGLASSKTDSPKKPDDK